MKGDGAYGVPLGDLIQRFRSLYLCEPVVFSHAGGRVNIIGEHTDYHEGFVLPCAIDLRTASLVAPDPDGNVSIYSTTTRSLVESPLANLSSDGQVTSRNYLLASVWVASRHTHPSSGVRALLWSSVPLGAGLSSSAALIVSMVGAIMRLWGQRLSASDVARLAIEAERSFCGVPCGVMDQMASSLGKRDHVLFVDCRSLATTHVPWPSHWALVVADTGSRHSVAGWQYRRRQQEAAAALRVIQENYPEVRTLRDVDHDKLRAVRGFLDKVQYRRVHHVVTENERVQAAVRAIRETDSVTLGRLLAASHESLASDYEVSSHELDRLVELAATIRGIVGSRMCGAGFGGSTINVVDSALARYFAVELRDRYVARTGRHIVVRQVHPSDGLHVGPL